MKKNGNMNPKKENRILVTLMSCLMAAFLLGCGGDSEVTTTTNTEEGQVTPEDARPSDHEATVVEEEQPEKEKEAATEEHKEEKPSSENLADHVFLSNDGRPYCDIGYEGQFTNDETPEGEYCSVVIEDINTTVETYPADNMDYLVPYIDFDIINKASVNIGFMDMNTSLYIDDYKVNTGLWMTSIDNHFPDIECGSVEVEPGRKAKFRSYATIPVEKADAADRIEIDYAGVTVLFKEDGKWLYGDQSSSRSTSNNSADLGGVVYGEYIMDSNIYGGYSEASIGFYTDEDNLGDYIYIKLYDDEGNPCMDYNGYSPESGNPSIFYDKYETGFQVTYTSDGIEVKGLADDEYEEQFNGYYRLDHALNLDEVG